MFGLSFLSPLFLVGAAAAAIPIAIHLFHRRAEPVIEFAAMRYLRRAPVEESSRRRLRELILLALRVAAIVLLACAFARPYVSEGASAAGDAATVVLIDTSASVTAPSQFDRIRERAEQVIRQAPPTHAVAVLSFAHSTEVIAPLGRDRAGALAAIAELRPGAGATRYRAALERAGEVFSGREGRLVVITDLQQSGWDAVARGGIPEQVVVDVESIEPPASNVAVTSLRLDGGDAIAAVQNYSARGATDQVVFMAGDRRVGAVPVVVPAAGTVEVRLPLQGIHGGTLTAAITDGAGYTADNVRYAVFDADSGISVLAVTSSGHPADALYLERALTIVDGAGGFRFQSTSGAGLGSLAPEVFNSVDVVVVLGTRGLEQRGRERLAQFLTSGGGVLVTGGPDAEPAVLREALTNLVFTEWRPRDAMTMSFAPDDSRHPVFRMFGGGGTLGNVNFTRAALLDAPAGATVVARYSDGTPALVEERPRGGRVLLFASDLNHRWNDFPLQPAFVPFIHETLRYLASPTNVRSEYLVGELPGISATPGVIDLPVGRTLSGPPGEPDKARPTIKSKRVAVNVDPRESDPRVMELEAFRAGISRLQTTAAQQARVAGEQQEEGQSLWRYALLLMVLGLAFEGLLGRRLG
jgi:hypothetical protein